MRIPGNLGAVLLCSLWITISVIVQPAWAATEAFGASGSADVPPPTLSARGAILMDFETGLVLWEKNAYVPMDPASTTKIMTAIVSIELGHPQDEVTISRTAAVVSGSRMGIAPGEVYTLDDLLHGLMMASGNDAAMAIAEYIGGSVANFVALMNKKAVELGALHTHFENPHGLTAPGHKTTAYDLALITAYAMRNPYLVRLVSTTKYTVFPLHGRSPYTLYSTNRLLDFFPGANGIKTGTTARAGQCLVSSATRSGWRLLAVVLHSGDRWSDSARLLEWGFTHFTPVVAGREDDFMRSLPVAGGRVRYLPVQLDKDLVAVVPKNWADAVVIQVALPTELRAPVQAGQVVGQANLVINGHTLARASLSVRAGTGKRSIIASIWYWLQEKWAG